MGLFGHGKKPEKQEAYAPDQLRVVDLKMQRVELVKHKPDSVFAIPSGTVNSVVAGWVEPTLDEKKQGVTAIFAVNEPVQPSFRLNGRQGGQRTLVRKVFMNAVPDAQEFGAVVAGVNFLSQLGSLNAFHETQIRTALQNPPPDMRARMDTQAELSAWQAKARPARVTHSAVSEWVLPVVRAFTKKIHLK